MNPKRFQGKTMAEALAKVKREFGSDAVIHRTRTFSDGGVLGYGTQPKVEITASKDTFSLPRRRPQARVGGASKANRVVEGATNVRSVEVENRPSADWPALAEQIGQLDSAVSALVAETRSAGDPSLTPQLREAYQRLIEARLSERLADRLVRRVRAELAGQQAQDPVEIRKRLAAHLEATLPIAEPVHPARGDTPTVIALVGPTGVGKTTTIAKLAAQLRLRHSRSVGLVAADTRRIGAVEQLRTYARIIDVPMEVAGTPEQMRGGIDALRRCDVILIDTAGCGQHDRPRLDELAELIRAACPDEVHLVLSLTAGAGVLDQTVERFGVVGVNRLIFTKLDEAVGFGVTVNCLRRAEAELSYVTTGQDVPDAITDGRAARLAQRIVSGDDAMANVRTGETGRTTERYDGGHAEQEREAEA